MDNDNFELRELEAGGQRFAAAVAVATILLIALVILALFVVWFKWAAY